MARSARTRSVSRAQIVAYASKAEEYVAAAVAELAAGRAIAATSLAIHAGISAADAVCGARLGKRSAGQNHDQLLVLLREAGRDGATVEKELRRLLPLKTKAEYEPEDIPISTAAKAVKRAERSVRIAQRVAAQ